MPQITATIASIEDATNKYEKDGNVTYYIRGKFSDGTTFSTGTKEAFVEKRKAELKGLIGQSGSFEVTPDGEYQGVKRYRLSSWPGKPERRPWVSGGGGGGGFGGSSYKYSEEGARAERDSIQRAVALQQAVVHSKQLMEMANTKEALEASIPGVLMIADEFYAWLSKPGNPGPQKEPPSVAQIQAQTQRLQGELEGTQPPPPPKTKPACPNCGKAEFVLEEREKPGAYFCWKNAAKKKLGCGHKWVAAADLAAAHGMKTGDQVEEPVLIRAIKAIEEATSVDTLAKFDPYIEARYGERVLEWHEYEKLSKLSAEKAIAVSKTAADFDKCSTLLRHMVAKQRIKEDYYIKFEDAKQKTLSIEEMKQRFSGGEGDQW